MARIHYVLAYDVGNNNDRLRLAKALLDLGDRIQKSVFEADLDAADLQKLLARARRLLADTDSLRVYPLCARCRAGIVVVGAQAPPPEDLLIL